MFVQNAAGLNTDLIISTRRRSKQNDIFMFYKMSLFSEVILYCMHHITQHRI